MPRQRIVHVVNRSLEPLEVMDDGMPWVIKPGYKLQQQEKDGEPVFRDGDTKGEKVPVLEVIGAGVGGSVLMVPLPYFAAERAKRQNPVMGTEDPYNPNNFESLIAVPDWNDDFTFCQQSDAIERLNRSLLPEQLQKIDIVQVRGSRKKIRVVTAKGKTKFITPGARGLVAGEAMENPAGIRLTD